MSALNWVDMSIISVIAFSMLSSFMRGFVKEVISIVSWVAAVLLSLRFAGELGHHFTAVSSEQIRYVLAFVAITIVTLLAGMILNVLVGLLTSKRGISLVDRGLGLCFGAGRGVLLVAVGLMLFQFTGMSIAI